MKLMLPFVALVAFLCAEFVDANTQATVTYQKDPLQPHTSASAESNGLISRAEYLEKDEKDRRIFREISALLFPQKGLVSEALLSWMDETEQKKVPKQISSRWSLDKNDVISLHRGIEDEDKCGKGTCKRKDETECRVGTGTCKCYMPHRSDTEVDLFKSSEKDCEDCAQSVDQKQLIDTTVKFAQRVYKLGAMPWDIFKNSGCFKDKNGADYRWSNLAFAHNFQAGMKRVRKFDEHMSTSFDEKDREILEKAHVHAVVSYKGSSSGRDWLANFGELNKSPDSQSATQWVNSMTASFDTYFRDSYEQGYIFNAIKFMAYSLNELSKTHFKPIYAQNVLVTGHSLGGALAQNVCVYFGVACLVFSSPGPSEEVKMLSSITRLNVGYPKNCGDWKEGDTVTNEAFGCLKAGIADKLEDPVGQHTLNVFVGNDPVPYASPQLRETTMLQFPSTAKQACLKARLWDKSIFETEEDCQKHDEFGSTESIHDHLIESWTETDGNAMIKADTDNFCDTCCKQDTEDPDVWMADTEKTQWNLAKKRLEIDDVGGWGWKRGCRARERYYLYDYLSAHDDDCKKICKKSNRVNCDGISDYHACQRQPTCNLIPKMSEDSFWSDWNPLSSASDKCAEADERKDLFCYPFNAAKGMQGTLARTFTGEKMNTELLERATDKMKYVEELIPNALGSVVEAGQETLIFIGEASNAHAGLYMPGTGARLLGIKEKISSALSASSASSAALSSSSVSTAKGVVGFSFAALLFAAYLSVSTAYQVVDAVVSTPQYLYQNGKYLLSLSSDASASKLSVADVFAESHIPRPRAEQTRDVAICTTVNHMWIDYGLNSCGTEEDPHNRLSSSTTMQSVCGHGYRYNDKDSVGKVYDEARQTSMQPYLETAEAGCQNKARHFKTSAECARYIAVDILRNKVYGQMVNAAKAEKGEATCAYSYFGVMNSGRTYENCEDDPIDEGVCKSVMSKQGSVVCWDYVADWRALYCCGKAKKEIANLDADLRANMDAKCFTEPSKLRRIKSQHTLNADKTKKDIQK